MIIKLRVFKDYKQMAECAFIDEYTLKERLFVGDYVQTKDGEAMVREVILDAYSRPEHHLYCNALLYKPEEKLEKEVD